MKALVLFSGGVDSTTCLALAVEKYGKENVLALSVSYGQKHSKELEAAQRIAEYYGVQLKRLDLSVIFEDSGCSLLKGSEDEIPNESYADLAETQGAIAFFSDCVTNEHLPYVLAIELKATGELLGDTGVSEVDGAPDELEIGYVITRAHAGKGYATEACRAIALFCTESFKAKVLWGRVVKGNAASARVLEKAGYTFLREETGAEDDPYGNGMLVYQLNL